MELLKKVTEGIKPTDREMMRRARERVDNLTKPLGSLGRLEEIAVRLCGITGSITPDVGKKSCNSNGGGQRRVCSEGCGLSPAGDRFNGKGHGGGHGRSGGVRKSIRCRHRVFDLGMKGTRGLQGYNK